MKGTGGCQKSSSLSKIAYLVYNKYAVNMENVNKSYVFVLSQIPVSKYKQ